MRIRRSIAVNVGIFEVEKWYGALAYGTRPHILKCSDGHFCVNLAKVGSAEPIPLSQYACDVLQARKKESPPKSEYVFPSPVVPNRPISTVKTAWKATLRRAGVTPFPIYTLRHVFCTRLSEVAPDAVVQRAMRHSSPETKRHYQLGMAEQVRHAVNKANKRLYGKRAALHFRDSSPQKDKEEKIAVCK